MEIKYLNIEIIINCDDLMHLTELSILIRNGWNITIMEPTSANETVNDYKFILTKEL